MKKFLYSLGILAASVLAFTACQKEQPKQDELVNNKLVTVTFTAEKAGLATKTAAVEGSESVSYIWTEEDLANMKLFTVGTEIQGEGDQQHEVEKLTEVANPTITKVSDTKLTISGKVAPGAKYTFRAILCDPASYTGTGNNYSDRKPKIKARQSPNGYNNFDPTADILVSEDMEVEVIESGEETVATRDLEMVFNRKVVVNKMTLKNLLAGEKVGKVVVTSTTKDIQGYLENGAMKGQGKVITLEYNDVVVLSNGEFPVYFTSMPNDGISLTVEVITDQHIYSKSFAEGKTIDMKSGQFTKFGVAMPAGVPVSALQSGDYFITGVNSSQVYAAKKYVSGNNLSNPVAITVNEEMETITYVEGIDDCIFTFTRRSDGSYTIQDVNGLYLFAASSSSNHLKGEDAPDSDGNAYWTISKNSDGTYAIEAAGSSTHNIMRFNYNNGSPMFSCYTSGQNPVTLYPATWCAGLSEPHFSVASQLGIDATANTYNVAVTRFNFSGAITVSVPGECNWITAENVASEANSFSIQVAANTGTARTATLTLSGDGVDSRTLVVNQAGVDYVILPFTYPEEGSSATSAELTAISGVTANSLGTDYGNNHAPYMIKLDGTGDYIRIKTDSEIGTVSVKYKMIGGASTSTLTIKQSADGTNYTNVQSLTISGTQNSTGVLTTNQNFAQSSRYVEIYFTKGSNVGIGGITITKAGSTPTPVTHTITINQSSETGCSISASVDGSPISNVASVEEGKTVNLTASAGSGYAFGSWSVTGATLNGNSFVVGSSNVTINATFNPIADKVWKLVTNTSSLSSGDKLIIVDSEGGFAAGDISSSIMASVSVTISNNTISSLPNSVVQLTLGGGTGSWTLTNSSNNLLGATAAKKVAWDSGTTTWSISISDGNATIQNGTSSYGKLLYNSGSPRFTTYTSDPNASMRLPQIYRYE